MKPSRFFLKGKNVFAVFLCLVPLIAVSVYGVGTEVNRSLLDNALISTSIIAALTTLFFSITLYKGYTIKDDLSEGINNNLASTLNKMPGTDGGTLLPFDADIPDFGDSIGGIIFALFFWLIAIVLIIILAIALSLLFWLVLMSLVALLYGAILRGTQLTLSHAAGCKGKLMKSVAIAGAYAVLYIGTVYGIFYFLSMVP